MAEAETTEEERIPLLSSAVFFAQMSEHLRRGNPLTQPMITQCRDVIYMLRDDTRRRIKDLLGM